MDCVLARLSQNVTNKYFSYSAMPAVPMAVVVSLGQGFGLCRCVYKHRRVERSCKVVHPKQAVPERETLELSWTGLKPIEHLVSRLKQFSFGSGYALYYISLLPLWICSFALPCLFLVLVYVW